MLAAALLVVGASAILLPLLMTKAEIEQDAAEYEQLREQAKAVTEGANPSSKGISQPFDVPLAQPPDAASPSVTQHTNVDLAACTATNADFIAWLQIPNTTVDYPVVWSDDTDYYLNHTFTGKKSYIGTLFSLEKTDYRTPSQNIAIYGHHIRSNNAVMFSPLLAYKEQSFYEEHKTVYLDTLYHSGTYTVFAVVNMRYGDWEPSTPDFSNSEVFLAFVARAKAQALYDTGVEVQASDQILTLITCDRSYGGKSGRLIVMAVNNQ